MQLPSLVVLFNPWCPEDWVYLRDEKERQEYVMNEQGTIFTGSKNYIFSLPWDYGQFEDNMVEICLMILDLNRKHLIDPGDDVSARCNPLYVGRVVSAMINTQDDRGVLEGNWGDSFPNGLSPSHWSGSYAILKHWYNTDAHPVKYGQCWVFAGVMCSVMRLLGIPCRVVSNFESAHDNNKNLVIDTFYSDYGVAEKPTHDSIWNFHVWTEAWMKRPDLGANGKYDGWQVLDPTPQEQSFGVYCCGPAPVRAILDGETDLKYDIPFVFAEVNADCSDWLLYADGSKKKIFSDTSRVGQNTSTKAVGSKTRVDITNTYKHKEGTEKERTVFDYAVTRDYSKIDGDEGDEWDEDFEVEGEEIDDDEEEDTGENVEVDEVSDGTDDEEEEDDESEDEETSGGAGDATDVVIPPPVYIQFEEMTPPTNGKNVRLKLILQSKSKTPRLLSINISVQAMRYNGRPIVNIQTQVKEKILYPGTDTVIFIRIPFSLYHKAMVHSDNMKVSVRVTDVKNPEYIYLAEDDIVLINPPISVKFVKCRVRVDCIARVEVIFMNPTINETLTGCTLTLSGSGLLGDELKIRTPDLKPRNRIRVNTAITPYKTGEKTLVADFDCDTFKDIKCSCKVNIRA
ncbi:protein-glutamine gamma-glutamyltransferase 5-like [Cottoperca gobio]|uniref:protein-glutamine gamma-glutamyltransferase n=1 Tax=Cottoperca gobio TaxID=56716 RepID=A0A6J2PBS8_COTGO|nr:protein-glutamine gamma-glutamyltransferase 5-like [Cottoperca gobio]